MPAVTAPDNTVAAAGAPAALPLAGLVPHPRNPRTGLGDLAEIIASIAANGVFEPLVVLTRAAYETAADADADTMRPGDGSWTHVIVMGHRRAAAARDAGLESVPAVVRDDLAGAKALAAMIAENRHREDLDPLSEAETMNELARRGWSQRQIAAEIGCSQAHVSKRLTLLKLPGPARDAVTSGKLSTVQALDLHQAVAGADDDLAAEAIESAVDRIESGFRPGQAIETAGREAARQQATRKTRAELDARGIKEVPVEKIYRLGWTHLRAGDIAKHEKAGCLAAVISWNGSPDYVCTNPASHPSASKTDTRRARELEDERESRKAAKARDAACSAIAAGEIPPGRELVKILTMALLENSGWSETLRLACKWLREAGIAPKDTDHYAWRKRLAADGDRVGLIRYALAYALAADELHARRRADWDDRHIAHVDRLRQAVGYEPTAWESERLDEARQVTEARTVLSCSVCGCTGRADDNCDVVFDRDEGKPAYRCAWDCPVHRNPPPAPADQDLPDGVEDLVISLICAIDPSSAAGSRLPDAIADATDQPGARLADAWDARKSATGAQDVLEAVRDVAAAAAPHEEAWPPELREALAALGAAGITPQKVSVSA